MIACGGLNKGGHNFGRLYSVLYLNLNRNLLFSPGPQGAGFGYTCLCVANFVGEIM